jgi:hypothetical protein
MANRVNNVVLVHGGFVDGSGWMGVFKILDQDGFNVSVVQNPTISLEGRRSHEDDPRPAARSRNSRRPLVRRRRYYRSRHTRKGRGSRLYHGLAPDAGESVNTLIANPPPGAPVPPILPPVDDYLFLDK